MRGVALVQRGVDAMALGNHDMDYGAEAFERCRESITYPVLSANLVKEDGSAILPGGRAPVPGARGGTGYGWGCFALAGPDMAAAGEDGEPASGDALDGRQGGGASASCSELREREQVDAVVFFGHEGREDDEALAREVPGIDVIIGTHSHHRGELRLIPGTRTYYVSPYQYLAYLSEVRLQFRGHKLEQVTGGLVKLDSSRPEDPEIGGEVAQAAAALEGEAPGALPGAGSTAASVTGRRHLRG